MTTRSSTTNSPPTSNTTNSSDQRHFRDTVGQYASGITIITGHDAEGPIGFTCQSFYSVSVDPPLVSFSVMKTSTTYPRIRDTGTFAVNIVSVDQETISNQFAGRGTDKWAGIIWNPTNNANPVLDGSLTWLDCAESHNSQESGSRGTEAVRRLVSQAFREPRLTTMCMARRRPCSEPTLPRKLSTVVYRWLSIY